MWTAEGSVTRLHRCCCISCHVEKQHTRHRKEGASGLSGFTVSFKDPLLRKVGKGEMSMGSSSSTTKKEG